MMPPLIHITHEEFGLLKLRLFAEEPRAVRRGRSLLRGSRVSTHDCPIACALGDLLTLQDSPLWATAILVLPVLIGQGIARNKAAGDRLVDTLVLEEIKSALLERHERKVDEAVAASDVAVAASEVAANKTTDQPQDAS